MTCVDTRVFMFTLAPSLLVCICTSPMSAALARVLIDAQIPDQNTLRVRDKLKLARTFARARSLNSV